MSTIKNYVVRVDARDRGASLTDDFTNELNAANEHDLQLVNALHVGGFVYLFFAYDRDAGNVPGVHDRNAVLMSIEDKWCAESPWEHKPHEWSEVNGRRYLCDGGHALPRHGDRMTADTPVPEQERT